MDNSQEREGGDITAQDMILPEVDPSEIQQFYSGSVVFITGATGFLGKILLEKLLRSCSKVTKIYILLRQKKGKDIETRKNEIFETVIFDRLKREQSNFMSTIGVLTGDCEQEDLGLSKEGKETVMREVTCIFHCAATVRFDVKLRKAAYINVRALQDLLKMSRKMKQLKSFVYISTAFSFCPRKEIDEEFYSLPIKAENLMSVIEALDDAHLDAITPTLLGEWPNTYVFSKAVAEDIIRKEGKGLPIAVVRPSIVLATYKEPVAGWIDNFYGPTGVLHGASMGLLRTLHVKPKNFADMVPADYVVNSAIAAGWDIATIKTINDNRQSDSEQETREVRFESEIPIYNYVSSPENPIDWDTYMALAKKHCLQVKTPLSVWYSTFKMRENIYMHRMAVYFLHFLPAYIVDAIAFCIRRKPILVKAYKKIDKFCDVVSYFSTRQWSFKNNNTQALWKRLKEEDRNLFDFNMAAFNWELYFFTYIRGSRVYLLKDPLDSIPAGERRYRKLQIAHYLLMSFLLLLLCRFLLFLYNLFVA